MNYIFCNVLGGFISFFKRTIRTKIIGLTTILCYNSTGHYKMHRIHIYEIYIMECFTGIYVNHSNKNRAKSLVKYYRILQL